MEKQRSSTRKKRHNRFLKTLTLLYAFLFLSKAYTQGFEPLQFRQQGDFAVSENNSFIIEIADVDPSEIEIQNTSFFGNVEFVSLTKNDGFISQSDGSSRKGTVIVCTFRFFSDGVYDLGSLPIRINSQSFSILFPEVTVNPNPSLLTPKISLDIQGDLYQLQESTLILYGQHFKSVENITVILSENALIEKTHSILDMPTTAFSFSNESIFLQEFSYIPFTSGLNSLPEIEVTFIGYNDAQYVVSLLSDQVEILPASVQNNRVYGQERKQPKLESAQTAPMVIYKNDVLVNDLLSLRLKEKYSLLTTKNREQRVLLEQQEGLQNEDEISFTWVMITGIFAFICTVLGFVFHFVSKQKKAQSTLPILFFCCAIILAGFVLYFALPLSAKHALMYGSQMYTIPEHESQVKSSVFAGTRVRILESVGEWYLVIQNDGRSGWVLQSDCVLIQR